MLLQQQKLLLEVLDFGTLHVDTAAECTVIRDMQARLLLEVGIPVKDLRAGVFGYVHHQKLLKLVS